MFEYHVQIVRVVDGDTIDVLVDLGFDVLKKERVRLAGVDTPESRTRDLREKKFGKLATKRVKDLLPTGSKMTARSEADSKSKARGKFGRYMLDFDLGSGKTLAVTLLKEHLAVPYHGQNKAAVRLLHEHNWDVLEGKKS